ncbi:hypothetical protein HHI36_002124 [Cryptolaemus montrouzieri]|uniref:Odorant receptor n=1 Tax=Cryptolaemus montrouzieri TaxID=559131 RepID=A0ABD2PA88_9CUCU
MSHIQNGKKLFLKKTLGLFYTNGLMPYNPEDVGKLKSLPKFLAPILALIFIPIFGLFGNLYITSADGIYSKWNNLLNKQIRIRYLYFRYQLSEIVGLTEFLCESRHGKLNAATEASTSKTQGENKYENAQVLETKRTITLQRLLPEQINSVALILGISGITMILIFGFLQMPYLLNCSEKLMDDTYGVLPNFGKICEQFDLLGTLAYYGSKCVYIIYVLICYFSNAYCTGRELRGDHRYVCGAICPLWYPIEMKLEIVMLIPLSVGVFMMKYTSILSCYPVMIWACVKIIVSRIKHLRRMLSEISDLSSLDNLKKLNKCMRYHESTVQRLSETVTFTGNNHLNAATQTMRNPDIEEAVLNCIDLNPYVSSRKLGIS